MNFRSLPYGTSLALFTDLYELTMAYGYWKSGHRDTVGAFQLFFRSQPFQGGLTVAAGLEWAIDFIENVRFTPEDLEYLASLDGADGKPLFTEEFLDYLQSLRFSGDLDAVPEGTVVFPHEPLLRLVAPLPEAQILETALLTILNFQTLVATKARRVVEAAGSDPVLEFGARRAQGIDGAISASRAAYIGGCAATSNVLAGKLFGIPVRGTHAHSWVMSFDSEEEAFGVYAEAMPNNCVFLVDTYDTLGGVRLAIEAGKDLRERGYKMLGIRLDSGDLASLSIEARRLLDDAGFKDALIVASSDLDEHRIEELKRKGAKIALWGVGTRLVTAWDQPALGGVYKLAAVKRRDGSWSRRLKVSDQGPKRTFPGLHGVRRCFDPHGMAVTDAIHAEDTPPQSGEQLLDGSNGSRLTDTPEQADYADLLVRVFRSGKLLYKSPPLEQIRSRVKEELARFRPEHRRLHGAEPYPVGVTSELYELRERMTRGLER